jgi:hypothetical protein
MTDKIKTKVMLFGFIMLLLSIIGLLGPWLTLSYDSYAVLNPITRLGEKHYRSRIELSPFYASVVTNEILEVRLWNVSNGTTLAGLIILTVSFLNVFKYSKKMIYFYLFISHILGLFIFFLSLGRGISLGLITQPGWGLSVTLLCSFILFGNSFYQITRGVVTRS